MNCRHARSDLALWVGQDLTDKQRRDELRRHVARCPECRSHYKRLKDSLRVLEDADRSPTYEAADSLWPELSNRIQRRAAQHGPASRFNGWLPFVAVTAASALLVVAMETRPAPQPSFSVAPIPRDFFSAPFVQPVPIQDPYGTWQPSVTIPPAASPIVETEPAPEKTSETPPHEPDSF
jgi:hypothetical protein